MEAERMRVIWVLQEFSITVPEYRYSGSWSRLEDETEEAERWHDFPSALAWARARAPRVLLHLRVGSGWGELASFSAGERPVKGFQRWNGSAAGAEHPVAGYSGFASITEEPYRFDELEMFRLDHELQMVGGDRSVILEAGERELRLDDAIKLARRRSEAVVVGLGFPGQYAYFNAGARTYAPDPYPPFPFLTDESP